MKPITKEWLSKFDKDWFGINDRDIKALLAVARAVVVWRENASPPHDHYDARLIEIFDEILSGQYPKKGDTK